MPPVDDAADCSPHPVDGPCGLREAAIAIFHAGVDAVRSDRLVERALRVDRETLHLAGEAIAFDSIGRIAVVGAGKAGAGMAAGLESALGEARMDEKRLTGWINVPENCVRKLRRIHLHGARPAGVNEPTEQGVIGSERILEIIGALGPSDLCICLLSGGGSALLPSPVDGVTLADKQAITRFLSGAGANIRELNTVRKRLSRIKGGGLARACGAGTLVTLIISDVLGDPLDVIASGPTVPDPTTASQAWEVVERFGAVRSGIAPSAIEWLRQRVADEEVADAGEPSTTRPITDDAHDAIDDRPTPRTDRRVVNCVIGNNATAVEAAGSEAARRGFVVQTHAADQLEGAAEEIGRQLARQAIEWASRNADSPRSNANGEVAGINHGVSKAPALRSPPRGFALISGGEPTVKLVDPSIRGRGGRNQQLTLAAFDELLRAGESLDRIVLLSAGTDGEDGPTDAAGALLDADVARQAAASSRSIADALRLNDAYTFFDAAGGLIRTGPTDTNVCDLRIVLVERGTVLVGR